MAQKNTSLGIIGFFRQMLVFFRSPGWQFGILAEQRQALWRMPMLIRSISLLLVVLVSGFERSRAALTGEITLPPDWQWWTADMQNNYMQAVQATQGPVFLYVIPAVLGLVGLWLGWGILSGLLHLASTLLGGRGTMTTALNISAWAGLPFLLRDLLRIVYMLFAGHAIASPGLSGFIIGEVGGDLFLASLLKHLDLFLVWQVVLLVIGFIRVDSLTRVKATGGVILVVLLTLLAQAGLGTLTSSLGGMMISRPFI